MSRTIGACAVCLAVMSVAQLGGCPAVGGPAVRLAGTWALTESSGTTFTPSADCAGISIVITAEGKVATQTECANTINYSTSAWVPTSSGRLRGVSSAATLGNDGSVTIDMVIEGENTESGVTTTSFTRMVLVGALSEDGQTLSVSSKVYRRTAATDPWTPQAGGETPLVFAKQ